MAPILRSDWRWLRVAGVGDFHREPDRQYFEAAIDQQRDGRSPGCSRSDWSDYFSAHSFLPSFLQFGANGWRRTAIAVEAPD
jgi:hypothetical protein